MRWIWVVTVLVFAPVYADDCIDCHDTDLGLESPYAWSFDPARYDADVHAALDCTDCHAGNFEESMTTGEPVLERTMSRAAWGPALKISSLQG